MTIQLKVLGKPAGDNAVYLTVNSGQIISRLLFDCGHGCLDPLAIAEIQSLDATFISHFHMDHVSGFDSLLRFNFARAEPDRFLVIGPEDTCRAIQHKLQGFTWNLVADSDGLVEVREFAEGKTRRQLYRTSEQFVAPASESVQPCSDGIVFEDKHLTVSMIELEHGCVSGGYLVREKPKTNVDMGALKSMNLTPGPWLQTIKDPTTPASQVLQVGDTSMTVGEFQQRLLKEAPGESFAYLTDFRATGQRWDHLVDFVKDVDRVVCENSYSSEDAALAEKNFHMTTADVANLAKSAGVGELILFHLSHRYDVATYHAQMAEAQSIFPNTRWPVGWFQEEGSAAEPTA